MSIIKVNHLEGTEIKKIYVFKGNHTINDGWKNENGISIFSEKESIKIATNSIPVELIDSYLHEDDTVSTVKKKIIQHTNLRISLKELYMFGVHVKKINPSVLYNQLTQVETLELTQERLCQYLLNLLPAGCDDVEESNKCTSFMDEDKDVYDFEEFMALKNIEWDDPQNITVAIGQKIALRKQFPYTVNPYNCIVMDSILKNDIDGKITTQNSNLLFEYGNLCENNIFICIAEEVLEYSNSVPGLTQKNFLAVYFPNLVIKENIDNLEQLKDQKIRLYDETKSQIDKSFIKYNEKIDLLYNIFYERKTDLQYQDNTPGILKMDFTMHPKYSVKLPLEILFKLIHSDDKIPMIKYNPGRERENIYRLFTNNAIATNGKNIPYLYTENGNKRGKIIKISRVLAKKKRVGFYIEYSFENNLYVITCEFESNGNINISINHNAAMDPKKIENVIRLAINEPILEKIKTFLEQSGYTYMLFDTFNDDNIEFNDITFISLIEIKKNIHLKNYLSCLSSVFTIIDGDLSGKSDEIKLKYKRVSNYNQMDSIDSFINEMRKNGEDADVIIRQVMGNFNLTEDVAKKKFADWASQVATETDLFENRRITIRTNTGFPLSITRDNTNFMTKISVTSINDVEYLRFLSIYIDTMLRMIIDKKSTDVKTTLITKLCKGKEIKNIIDEVDIKGKEIKFVDSERADDFFDIFGLEQNDVDEEEDEMFDMSDVQFDDIGDTSKTEMDQVDFGNFVISDSPQEKTPSPIQMQTEGDNITTSPTTSDIDDLSPKSDLTSEAEVSLEGTRIKGNYNIFIAKKEELEPKLFLKKKQGRYNAYSKSCPSEYSKQPVMLTGKEKKYIDDQDTKFGTKSYDEHITYGTGDKKYHYICPRYWCLNDDNGKSRSISFEDINNGKCGGWDALIPQGADKVPPGKRIVEFTDDRFHKSEVKTDNALVYKPMFPSFMSTDKHPDGLCVPCCYGKPTTLGKGDWIEKLDKKGKITYENIKTKKISRKVPLIEIDTMYQPVGDGTGGKGPTYQKNKDGSIIMSSIKGKKTIREKPAPSRKKIYGQCNQSESKMDPSIGIMPTNAKNKFDEAPLLEAWPLRMGQLGYLPLSVQKFMGYNCKEICQQSASETRLKMNQPCLLHKGIQKSPNQSFLACIADMYGDMTTYKDLSKKVAGNLTKNPLMMINEIKDIIIEKISFDKFLTIQNGDLVNVFGSDDEINFAPYTKSVLYKSLQKSMNTEDFKIYFTQVVNAFINFQGFIKSKDVTIDYKYLWDIICTPGLLFEKGLNLVILNSPEDDITSRIELICPTNQYSAKPYDINRKILILYSRNGFFEPIYRYTRTKKTVYDVRKLFYLPDIGKTMPELEPILRHVIWTSLTKKCKPLPSLPITYNEDKGFRINISSMELINVLRKSNIIYKPVKQVLNFNSKVIGIIAIKTDDSSDFIYIPCLPSSLDSEMPYIFIGRADMWQSYSNTAKKLTYLSTASKRKIISLPKYKVVNSAVIVGIITETNQFIPTLPTPYQAPVDGEEDDGLPVLDSKNYQSAQRVNYLDTDKNILTDQTVDNERMLKVKQIRLESYFYNVFRNLLRIIFSYYENKTIKNELYDAIMSYTTLYLDKVESISERIKTLLMPYVDFHEYDVSTINKIENIEQCIKLSEGKCKESKFCSFSEGDDGVCKLLLPNTNLISGGNNRIEYFARIASELIKFDRIRTFIFKPQTFLSFQSVSYNLKDNEIILLEDILYGDYFENMIPVKKNIYIKNTNTWDNTEPNKTVPYDNQFGIDILMKTDSVNPCVILEPDLMKLSLGKWRDQGFDNYQIREFRSSINCSWELIREIINNNKTDLNIKLNTLVSDLIEIYGGLLNSGNTYILDIMRAQGKRDQADSLKAGTSIENIITTTNYYLTVMDFFVLSQKYQLPLIILCRTQIPTTNSKFISFINGDVDGCYIIFSGSFASAKSNVSPKYGILTRDDSAQLNIITMNKAYDDITKLNITTVDAYIQRAKLAAKLGKRVRKKVKVIVKKGSRVPKVIKKGKMSIKGKKK
jgi:hypothetical protein